MKNNEQILATLLSKLEKYPQLNYQINNNCITIDVPTVNGFTVWLSVNKSDYTVGYDGWHEKFDNEESALNAFAFGLSNQYRLATEKRGKTACKWVLEFKDGDEWKTDSETGLIFIPFWRKKSIEYRQNNIIDIE